MFEAASGPLVKNLQKIVMRTQTGQRRYPLTILVRVLVMLLTHLAVKRVVL